MVFVSSAAYARASCIDGEYDGFHVIVSIVIVAYHGPTIGNEYCWVKKNARSYLNVPTIQEAGPSARYVALGTTQPTIILSD